MQKGYDLQERTIILQEYVFFSFQNTYFTYCKDKEVASWL